MIMSNVSTFSTKCLDAIVAPAPIRDVGGFVFCPLTCCRRVRCSCNPSWLNLSLDRLGFTLTADTLKSGTSRIPDQIIDGENRWAYGSTSLASN